MVSCHYSAPRLHRAQGAVLVQSRSAQRCNTGVSIHAQCGSLLGAALVGPPTGDAAHHRQATRVGTQVIEPVIDIGRIDNGKVRELSRFE